MKQNEKIKEIFFICLLSLMIGLVYNYFSPSGLSLIRVQKELRWESDSTLFGQQKINPMNTDTSSNKGIIKNPEISSNIIAHSEKKNRKDTALSFKEQPLEGIQNIEKKIITDTPVVQNKPPEKTAPAAILIEQAYKIYEMNMAVFVDARIEFDYNLLHIKGSISIPFKKFDELKYRLNSIPKDKMIVTYCDGRGCEESIELAEKIINLGYTNVKVFYGGWVEWKEKNYPTEK